MTNVQSSQRIIVVPDASRRVVVQYATSPSKPVLPTPELPDLPLGTPGDYLAFGADGQLRWNSRPWVQRSRGAGGDSIGSEYTIVSMPVAPKGDGQDALAPKDNGVEILRSGVYLILAKLTVSPASPPGQSNALVMRIRFPDTYSMIDSFNYVNPTTTCVSNRVWGLTPGLISLEAMVSNPNAPTASIISALLQVIAL